MFNMQTMLLPKKPWPTGLSEECEPLVQRILAPNPSPYTYTGTQTYLVGNASDTAIIDPGPNHESHINAILSAVGHMKVKAIMCTHTHRDHSPAAAPLKKITGAPIIGCAPLVINSDLPRSDEAFDNTYAPDQVLKDGDCIKGDNWTLQAVFTPGHTSNHLCFALEESGALFTGDHVMGWSTSVVIPPDGNMGDYMDSLEKLQKRNDRIYYSAHGEPIKKPQQLVRGMMGHRRQREKQIIRLLEDSPKKIPDFIPEMYKGLDERLHQAAQMSVMAHLIDLQDRGLVDSKADGFWETT